LTFDALFIASEYERLGYSSPLGPTSGLCTMRLASRYLADGPRALEACCECIGYRIESAHTALGDVHAAARLLVHYIASDSDFLHSWSDVISTAQKSQWPGLSPQGTACVTRQTATSTKHEHFLGRLASRAPRSEIHPAANSYLALLDRVLLDRQVSRHEEDELVSAAQMMGLSGEEALGLHRRYLCALGRLALADGIVTARERADLELVAELLGLSTEDVETSLHSDAQAGVDVCAVNTFSLKPGDAVAFTGETPGLDRADLEYQARALGLRISGSVSRKTSLVVAADPDSISGKARRARDLGIPIVDYATYLGMLDSISCQCPT
jgi:DNA polymerase-3 subunit epsilon